MMYLLTPHYQWVDAAIETDPDPIFVLNLGTEIRSESDDRSGSLLSSDCKYSGCKKCLVSK